MTGAWRIFLYWLVELFRRAAQRDARHARLNNSRADRIEKHADGRDF
ncbi:hypothetical protein [Hansschlegelia zhihuaiae]|nr:hypothetical protein [Hansschlegelia zhihuaiae]